MFSTADADELKRKIDQAMVADRHRLRRWWRSLLRGGDAGARQARDVDRLRNEVERSCTLRQRRQASVPAVTFDGVLPICDRLDEIRRAIAEHPVIIVCGETGCGKSTQLPKLCLQLGRGVAGLIGHTQPRRIAARAIATRLADELGVPLGRAVGFKVRFTDTTQPETLVKLMTDGMLLAETQGDRFLDQYDTIIVDEAHERSLNIDFLLGYIRRLLPKRPDLKLIITSATIDAQRFSAHFADPDSGRPAPIIEVSGRTFPVEIRYRPLRPEEPGAEELNVSDAIAAAVAELATAGSGDLLVFLPTERDIREAARTLRGGSLRGAGRQWEILPLYARLSAAEQARIFQPHAQRRIVLATNVAESSLTVPGIRFVVDTGTARISRYSPRRKVQRLPIEPVAQAAADQRAGRCGRLGPGICIRLYAEEDYQGRERYTTPEIRRTNLAAVILQTKALGLGEIQDFPFLDPPRADMVVDGYNTLVELGAIDEQRQLTDTGRRLARLPVDPRIGRMILAAEAEGCLQEVLIIAAALEVQDPRERPAERAEAADQCHAQFADPASDFLAYLHLWDAFHDLRAKLSRSQLSKVCRQNFLSFNRLREWLDVHRQLRQLADEAGLKLKPRRDDYDAIHRALLSGLLSNVALRTDQYEYTGAGRVKFYLWPGSGVFATEPKWIVAAELVETTRRYARTVARIEPRWIEPLAGHLVERSYRDPHYAPRPASVMAFEKVTLFGLPIVRGRRVPYGPLDPETARELFIRHGLIEGQFASRADFQRRNQELLAELNGLAARCRRPDLFVGDKAQFQFYDERIPADVFDGARFERWHRRVQRKQRRLLLMRREDLLPGAAEPPTPTGFPDTLDLGHIRVPLAYRFEPGEDDDGITLTVPQAALGQLTIGRLGWLVPGLLEEKIVALIRCLPKAIRRNLAPAPDAARRALAELRFGEGEFLPAVAGALQIVCGESVTPQDFQLEKLPQHLQINVRVVDEQGRTVAQGRSLETLRAQCPAVLAAAPSGLQHPEWRRDGIHDWDFGDLPERVQLEWAGLTLTGFPMLVDRGASVSLRLAETPEQAAAATRAGLRRLCCLTQQHELRAQVAWLPRREEWELYAAPLFGPGEFERCLTELIAERAFLNQPGTPRSPAEFAALLDRGRQQIGLAVQDVTGLLGPLWEGYQAARLALEQAAAGGGQYALDDMHRQLQLLVAAGFLTDTPWDWLQHYPRYLRGIVLRVDKLGGGLARDRQNFAVFAPFWESYRERLEQHRQRGVSDPALQQFRWLLEEFRVSLFAQELGTTCPVSAKRLEKHWAQVRR
jgi:ATP-dependent helicase HrpA